MNATNSTDPCGGTSTGCPTTPTPTPPIPCANSTCTPPAPCADSTCTPQTDPTAVVVITPTPPPINPAPVATVGVTPPTPTLPATGAGLNLGFLAIACIVIGGGFRRLARR